MNTLDHLGLKYGTDKASNCHNYLIWYEKYLAPFRDKKITVFEIGVGSACSLYVWRDYFLKANIIGFDQNDLSNLAEERIAIEVGDQGKEEDLIKTAKKYGSFNIIVDDGGHNPEHQILSYRTLLPYLNSGGLYILEDMGDRTVIDFIKQIADNVICGNTASSDTTDNLSSRVESVSFYCETTITCIK